MMERTRYLLTFADSSQEIHTMTAYGWLNASKDCDIAFQYGWALISLVRL